MATQIKFGTSGWRAVTAEEFTFANVRRAVNGIARYVASEKPAGARVIVGRDPRFLGETFCSIAAEILAAHGITPLVIGDAAPTPAISYAVIREHADGAINFTASHNPPEYNGIKFSTPDGAPALPEATDGIEAEIAAFDAKTPWPRAASKAGSQPLDPRGIYLARLQEIIDFKIIQKAGLRVVYDPLWGAARGYPDSLLRDAGVEVASVHDYRDVLFGGHAPEPDDHLLEDLREKMRATKAHIGIATDGDADRFGIVDEDGTFFQPNYIIALAVRLSGRKPRMEKWRGQVGSDDQHDQCAGEVPRGGVARNARRLQIHWRTDQAGQGRNRWRRERRPFDPPPCAGKRWDPRRPALLRDGGTQRQITWAAIAGAICQSWFLLSSARELPLDGGCKREVHWETGTESSRLLRP